jgi:hypothetical protein
MLTGIADFFSIRSDVGERHVRVEYRDQCLRQRLVSIELRDGRKIDITLVV